MKRLIVIASVIMLCAFAASNATGQDLRIGTLFDHTGALQDWGTNFQHAAELAAKQMAAAGFEIEFIHEDSGTAAVKAIKAAKKLVEEDKVAAIVGSGSSGVTVPVAEAVTCPNNVLMISPGSTSPFISILPADSKKDFLFRTCPSDALQGVILGKLAAGLYKSASVMHINNPYGQGLTDQFRKSFQKRGGMIYTTLPHGEEVGSSYVGDLRKAFARIHLTKPFRSGKSDVLCVFSYPEHAKVYVKEAIKHFKAKHFLFCDGSKSEELAKVVGAENLEGMMGTAPGVGGGESYANFAVAFKAEFGDITSVPFIANAYDATALIGLAAYAAKVKGLLLTSRFIRDQLRMVSSPPGNFIAPGEFDKAFELLRQGKDINYEGASGSVDFDENGDVLAPIEVWKFSKGKIVTVRVEYQIPEE
ncbi:MAG: ABC transporter substrate-binding protein [Desulfobacteraceae bacterium]|nr:ABC transporter substrate-binding protein [Desulfobacteraceae bacterium]